MKEPYTLIKQKRKRHALLRAVTEMNVSGKV
jgi:hypothetical protein